MNRSTFHRFSRRLAAALLVHCALASGAADTTPPTVRITAPTANLQINTTLFTAAGSASDNTGVGQVFVRFGTAPFRAVADGAGQWSYTGALFPGTNIISSYAVDIAGNLSRTTSVTVFRTVKAPLLLDTSPANAGSVSGVANGQQLLIGRAYIATASPRSGYVFARWIGPTFTSTTARLTFLMETNLFLEAEFAVNPFKPVAGTYSGIFQPRGGGGDLDNEPVAVPTALNSGLASFTVSTVGGVSGRLQFAGRTLSFSGQFDYLGEFVTQLVRPPSEGNLTLRLQLNAGSTNLAAGTVTGPGFVAPVTAGRQAGRGYTGNYTFSIAGARGQDWFYAPGGYGAGTISIASSGTVRVSGTLADGTPITASATISRAGTFPLFQALYSGSGLLLGSVVVDTNTRPVFLASQVRWIKPPRPGTAIYPVGFNSEGPLFGVAYVAPKSGTPWATWTANECRLSEGLLPTVITNLVIAGTSAITAPGATNGLTFKLTPSTGLASGKFVHPLTGSFVNWKGALLQVPESLGGTRVVGAFPASLFTGALLVGPDLPGSLEVVDDPGYGLR